MNLSTISNVVVIVLCLSVLVQVTRMIIAFRVFQKSDIRQTVAALDHATERAAAALSEFRHVLATEAAANGVTLSVGEALRDELSVMVGVGNSIADRIMEAASIVAPSTWGAPPEVGPREEAYERDRADTMPDEADRAAANADRERVLVSAGGE